MTTRGDYLPDHLAELAIDLERFVSSVVASGLSATPVQVAIAFGLAQHRIQSVLVGVRSKQELMEALGATTTHLPDDLLAELATMRLEDANLLNPATWGIP